MIFGISTSILVSGGGSGSSSLSLSSSYRMNTFHVETSVIILHKTLCTNVNDITKVHREDARKRKEKWTGQKV